MGLDKNDIFLSQNCEFTDNNSFGDSTLRLSCFSLGGSNMNSFGSSQRNLGRKPSISSDDGCRLVLGLGPTPSAYCDDHSKIGKMKKKSASILHKGLLSEGDSILKLGLFGGAREAFNVIDCSVSTQTDAVVACLPKQVPYDDGKILAPIVDEGSTSAKSGGYMPSLLLAPRMDRGKSLTHMQDLSELGSKSRCLPCQLSPEPSAATDFSVGTISEPTNTETSSDSKTNNPKKCKFVGCAKGARGASDLCIGHGGGHRCQKPGCSKGAESQTPYCKAHGGGRRCQHLGCTKSAEGKADYCISLGGGRRCGHPTGCHTAARGKSGLCIRHGGGKRCMVEGCTRSAEGQAGLCISHGGGHRCQYQGCSKGAQGSTIYCKAHGGGKRCIFAGCMKGAEGSTPLCKGHGGGKRCLFDGGGICPKSVHGGTNFCVAHGGGKRCTVPGCTKSARGRTDCCVKHGGGKRCHIEHCGKSAQGSTNFCKAHGGGKRCSWGEGKCEKFARGKSGLCTAHSSLVQERETKKGGLIGPGLFHGLVSAGSSIVGSSLDNDYSSSGISVVSDCIDTLENPAKRQHLIPPQVLVPLSMKSSPSAPSLYGAEEQEERRNTSSLSGGADWRKSIDFMIPEGRVHGGGLMSLFGGI